jgi:hypothetical protein
MPFRHITIVNVDGRHGESLGAQYALLHSARELPGAAALLLSPQRPQHLLDGVQHIPIQPLGYFEYGLFVIYALHRFIATEFALIVQDDGWVLSGSQWREEYCRYDYVGAPVHLARVATGQGTRYLEGFQWVNFLGDPSSRIDVVLNGGFSLRSKKLLQAPTMLALPYIVPPPTSLPGPPYRMYWESYSHLEDVYLCINVRPELERSGIKFAPLDMARKFAVEHLDPTLHKDLDLMKVFGHHSKLRKLKSLDPLAVHYQISKNQLAAIPGENLIAELFHRRGYKMEFAQN